MDLAPGTHIAHYELVAPLGAGGMGFVYQAHDTNLDRDVAIKFLAKDRDPAAVKRFIREARAASALNHPNIVTIFEIGEASAGRFIVMELVRGRTLRELVTARPSIDSVADVAVQIARALTAAHAAGIVHRDIKPENVMVREDGYVKLLDFGLARQLSGLSQATLATRSETFSGGLLGTVRYMSPEQARGDVADCASDVFSLGVVLYELTTGFHPFQADSPLGVLQAISTRLPMMPTRLNPEITSAFERLVLDMLQKDARLRPSAPDVAARLAELSSQPRLVMRASTAPADKRHMVGRGKELDQLFAAFQTMASGRGLLMCVVGEPGIGKTTLVDDFLYRLTGTRGDVQIARGRCSERLAGTEAYLPFIEALDSLLHSGSAESAAPVLRLLAPTWYSRLTPSSGTNGAVEMRSGSQDRMKRELGAFLQEQVRSKPLVIFLEDVHWADASTTDLIDYLANRFEDLPILVLATFRPTELLLAKHPFQSVKLDLQGRGLCREIQLTFLAPEDVLQYVTLEFPENDFPSAFSALIHTKTEGNPLFMADLVSDMRRRGGIVDEGGRWRVAQSMTEIERELPESIRSMIQRKIGSVGEDDRKLLIAASVQGYEFDSAVVATALGMDQADTEEHFDVLEGMHALVRFEGEKELPGGRLTVRYRFVHALYQNALFSSLRATRRVSLSAAIAQALLKFYTGRHTNVIASRLAFLFEAARNYMEATQYYLAAAQEAAHLFANQEAVTLARHGMALLRTLPDNCDRQRRELQLQIALAGPLTAIRGYADADVAQAYTRAIELCHLLNDTPQLFLVLHGLYRFHFVKGELNSALNLGEQLHGIAQRADDAAMLVEAHRALGLPLIYLGEFARAREHLDCALELYDPQKHRSHIVLYGADPALACYAWRSLALWFIGSPEQALASIKQSLALAAEITHPFSRAYARILAAWLYQYRREPAEVRIHTDAAIEMSTEHGFAQWLAVGRMLRGWARVAANDVSRGIEDLRVGHDAFRATGGVFNLPHFLALLAEALGRAGQLDEALAVISEALSVSLRQNDRCYEAELKRLKGELLLQQGCTAAQAGEAFQQALETARMQGAKSLELRAATSLARLYSRTGRREEGRTQLIDIYRRFTEGFETPDLTEARTLLSEMSPDGGG
jgi:predicted ATPase/predicted Ser/Thr protein kinase